MRKADALCKVDLSEPEKPLEAPWLPAQETGHRMNILKYVAAFIRVSLTILVNV